jgi:hypothetical protein
MRQQTSAIGGEFTERETRTRRPFPSIERNRAKNFDSADHALNLAAEIVAASNAESGSADGKIMEPAGSKAS